MDNKSAKEKLIELYGDECFIEKLHLRRDTEPRHYSSKGQYRKMKQLTFHHIIEKNKGGEATVENGAILSQENHIWFNKQSSIAQAKMNKMFQEYKKCGVVFVDDLDTNTIVSSISFIPVRDLKYNRAKEKEQIRKRIKEYEESEI